jgi:hypothetical protein
MMNMERKSMVVIKEKRSKGRGVGEGGGEEVGRKE